MELRDQLEQMLHDAANGSAASRSVLEQFLNNDVDKRIVLFGAGNLGRQFADVLRRSGLNVVAFADNQQRLWNTEWNGVPILSPEMAVSKFAASALFVVTLWHPCEKSDVLCAKAQLHSLGAKKVVPFSLLLESFPGLLPRMFWSDATKITAHAAEIVRTFDSLSDDCSRLSYVRALRLRLYHDFEATDHVAPGRQYFPQDVFALTDEEVFVDCGAYDGDSMSDFIEETDQRFRKILAFEADPHNAQKLRSKAAASGFSQLIHTFEVAVGDCDARVKFSADGAASAAVSTSGELEVQCARLDTVLREEHPTFIKMDIEGAESEALAGASQVIARCRPILAICIYHRPSDLWELPAQMLSLMPRSRLYLRSHRADGFDLVCYAVPHERGNVSQQ